MVRAAINAGQRASALLQTVPKTEPGNHRARSKPLLIAPLVVLWGAAQHSLPDDVVIDAVSFAGGRKLVPWLRALKGASVDQHAARKMS